MYIFYIIVLSFFYQKLFTRIISKHVSAHARKSTIQNSLIAKHRSFRPAVTERVGPHLSDQFTVRFTMQYNHTRTKKNMVCRFYMVGLELGATNPRWPPDNIMN